MDSVNTENILPRTDKSKAALVSFILGLVSLAGMAPLAFVSIVFGIIGLRNVRKYDLLGKKEAMTGIIVSIANIILSAIIIFLFFFGTGTFFKGMINSKTKDFEVVASNDMGECALYLYLDKDTGYSKCPPELEPYIGTRIILTDETFAQLPESLQKALSVNYDSIRCPEPVYRPTGKEQYAIEVKEYSFKIFVINEKEEWQTFPLMTTLY